jgi:hypothetical protein
MAHTRLGGSDRDSDPGCLGNSLDQAISLDLILVEGTLRVCRIALMATR